MQLVMISYRQLVLKDRFMFFQILLIAKLHSILMITVIVHPIHTDCQDNLIVSLNLNLICSQNKDYEFCQFSVTLKSAGNNQSNK